jgi:hypothetical protein
MNPLVASAEAKRLRIGDEVNLVAERRKFNP